MKKKKICYNYAFDFFFFFFYKLRTLILHGSGANKDLFLRIVFMNWREGSLSHLKILLYLVICSMLYSLTVSEIN